MVLLSGVRPLVCRSSQRELVSNRHFHEAGIAVSIDNVVLLGPQLSTSHEGCRIDPLVQLRPKVGVERLDPPAGRAHQNGLLFFHIHFTVHCGIWATN